MGKQDFTWIEEVLNDIITFTKNNGLHQTAKNLKVAVCVASEEIGGENVEAQSSVSNIVQISAYR